MDISTREPRGLRKLLRNHAGSTGVVVHGWFNRLPGWASSHGWNAITVRVDGVAKLRLYQVQPGPRWLDLDPGEHLIEFLGTHDILRSECVELARGQAVLIAFKPSERMPFGNRVSAEMWTSRQLW